MRCVWLIYGELDQPTGGYVYDRLVISGLRAAGHVVDVVSLEAPGFDAVAFAASLERAKYDAIIGDELCHPELAPLFALLRERCVAGPKLVLLVHHLTASETGVMVESERQVLALAELVVTTSHTTQREVAPWCAAASVIVPGADRLKRAVRREPDARLQLLFVGTWTPRKGLLRLVEYLQNLSGLEFTLTIVGDTARDEAHAQEVRQALARAPWLTARTRVCGVVSDAELAEIYARSDVLVLPSSYEGYGMVLSEALFAGVSVVVADVGATREVVGAHERAVLLPSLDVDAWVQLLRQLVSDPAQSRQAESVIGSLPTWAGAVSQWVQALTAVVRRA